MAKRPSPGTPMCVVKVGLTTLLMPASAGLKLVTALGGALEVEDDYLRGTGYVYRVTGEASVQYQSVRADQVRMPVPSPMAGRRGQSPLLLEGDGT
ncbi:MAG: hypothetical protein IIZ92_28725 [Aquincola sp.]|nr:hypothetical protein [Aquincola sp.]